MASDQDYCTCCELPPNSCGKAAAARAETEVRKQRAELVNRGWFPAQFPGSCRECGEDFKQGDLIKGGPGYGHRCRKYYGECCSDKVGMS